MPGRRARWPPCRTPKAASPPGCWAWATDKDAFALAAAAEKLPAGLYRLGEVPDFCGGANAALAWLMGGYSFDRYKKKSRRKARLVTPTGVDGEEISRIAENLFLARDLVNTPANDMGPAELEAAARALAKTHGAKVSVVSGAALTKNYPLIAAVGEGSPRAPRLIELNWGKANAPLVTLVGKGVCFDTGGYDLKPSAAMLTMKKDMGGAACVLAVGGHGDGRETEAAPAGADSGGGKFGVGHRHASGRCLYQPQGPDGGDRQYRCRRPPDSGRRLGRCR